MSKKAYSPSAFFGILLGVGILMSAIFLTAEEAILFVNLPGLGIVIGGTLAATLVSYRLQVLASAFASLFKVLMSERRSDLHSTIEQFSALMHKFKKEDMRALEENISHFNSPYMQAGLQMVLDGGTPEDIERVLDWRTEQTIIQQQAHADVFKAMAAYSPAFGMVGTLLGLINMLVIMEGGDFSQIGPNMAVALLTTFYGVILGNMLFRPAALKLEQRLQSDLMLMNFSRELIASLSLGKSPGYTKLVMEKIIESHDDELGAL